ALHSRLTDRTPHFVANTSVRAGGSFGGIRPATESLGRGLAHRLNFGMVKFFVAEARFGSPCVRLASAIRTRKATGSAMDLCPGGAALRVAGHSRVCYF